MKNLLRLSTLFFFAGPLSAETMQCADPRFVVTGNDTAVLERACKVVSDSREALASCGVLIERPIAIEVKEAIEGDFGSCLGLYRCGEDLIEMLSPEAMRETRDRDGPFELVSEDAYWDSVLIHELTHAAYDKVICPFSACVATAEYASYAMQVRTLPNDQQALFGQTIELSGKPSHDSISAMMLFLSPDHFAKYAWLHFQAREDSCGYMQLIMDGNIFFDYEPL